MDFNENINTTFVEEKILKQKDDENTIFRKFVEASSEGLGMADLEGNILYANHSLCRFLGVNKPDKVYSTKFFEYYLEDDLKRLQDEILPTVIKEGYQTVEMPLVSSNGKITPTIQGIFVIRDDQGSPICLANMITDITERKRAEEDIRKVEDFYESILENIISGVWVTNKEDVIYYANERMGMIAEIPPSQIVGTRVLIDFPKSTLKFFRSHYLKAKRTLKPVYYDSVPVVTPEGRQIYQSGWLIPKIEDGNYNGMICSVEDITERKQAEKALKESEKRYHNIIENACDAIFLIDMETGIILDANKRTEELLSLPREKIVDSQLKQLFPTEEAERFINFFQDASQSGGTILDDVFITNKDGQRIPVEISAITTEVGDKKITQSVFRDISERKRLEEEAKMQQLQLIQADKLASLGEVVAGVAHEINNPNSFISNNIPLLEETWKIFEPVLSEYASAHPEWRDNNISFAELRQDMSDIIHAIKIGSERINNVVTNLKDFAHSEEGAQIQPVDVNEVINKTLTIVSAQVRKSVSSIDLNLGENLPEIPGYFHKLEQVVANIIVNALHAISVREKGILSIRTRYLKWLPSVVIEIEDNGIGIEPSGLNRIFEPFYTTRRQKGGTGLGLSISYQLIQEHNGLIGVMSRSRRGTRFSIFLPLDRHVELKLQPSILCVDDDPSMLSTLKSVFFNIKNQVVNITENPENVVSYLEEHPEVDIVMSDVMMPGINGWELLAKIKKRFPLIAVILYSGDLSAKNLRPKDTPQPDFYLEKPFGFNDIKGVINIIGRQKL